MYAVGDYDFYSHVARYTYYIKVPICNTGIEVFIFNVTI